MQNELPQANQVFEFIQPKVLTNLEKFAHFKKITDRLLYEVVSQQPFLTERPYQAELAALYCCRRYHICSGAPGIGKTLITALVIAALYKDTLLKTPRRAGLIQIAVPSLLSANTRWLQDLLLVPALQGKVQVISSVKQLLKSEAPIWIYTHDFPKLKIDKYTHCVNKTVSKLLTRKYKPVFLILDEVHNLKPGSKRSDNWSLIRARAQRVLALSGTISDGRLDLVYWIAKFIYKEYFNKFQSCKEFEEYFSATKKIKSNYILGEEEENNNSLVPSNTRYLNHLSTRKLPEYSELSRKFFHRVRLSDPDVVGKIILPNAYYTTRIITPHTTHQEHYLSLLKQEECALNNFLQASSVSYSRGLSLISPLLKASLFPPTNIPNIKLSEIIKDCTQPDSPKTAIFTTYIKSARLLKNALLEHLNLNQVCRLYAKDESEVPVTMSNHARQQVVNDFLYNPLIKVGIFSINICSTSIDLNNAARLIFYDFPWQPILVQQCLHRVLRPGNLYKDVEIVWYVNKGQIDQHAFNLIQQKLQGLKLVLDFEPYELDKEASSNLNLFNLVQSSLTSISPTL